MQCLQGDDQAGDPALHVVGAAAEEVAVALGEDERLAEPLLPRLHIDGVDVAVEQDAAAAAGAGEDGGELRPADEVKAGRHEPVAGPGRLRLPHVGRRSQGLESRGQHPLQLLLIARGVAGVPRGRVAGDELGGEPYQLVLRVPCRVDHPLLER